jgi:hypothetical protein
VVGVKEVVDDEGVGVGVGVYSLPEVKVLKYGMGEMLVRMDRAKYALGS